MQFQKVIVKSYKYCKIDMIKISNKTRMGIQGEDMKRHREMRESAIQPVPAQTADLSISGLRFMSLYNNVNMIYL